MQYENASVSERRYLPPAVAVSAAAFALHPPAEATLDEGVEKPDAPAGGSLAGTGPVTLWIPLVRRTRPPFEGYWALPGGPIAWDETLVDRAERSLRSTVLRDPGYLEQLYAFGGVERSAQAQRLVTIAYWALYGERELAAEAGPEVAPGTAWFSADRLPELAFDHGDIVDYALWRLRLKTEYSTVAHRFLGPVFTLARLRRVHEAILGHTVDPANFRRQALSQGHLVDTGTVETGTRHRPARLFRFRADPDHEIDSRRGVRQ